MRRFEKTVEENNRRKDEQKIDFIIKELKQIAVTTVTNHKERQTGTTP